MKLLRRFFLIFKLDRRTIFLFLEAYITLAWARILLLIPFAKLARQLGNKAQETSNQHAMLEHSIIIKHVASAVNITSRYTLWDSKCLVRAIAGSKMLERRRIDSTLYMGTARDEYGQLIAHAWLRSGPLYITGASEMFRFTVVENFAKVISPPKR